MLSMDMGLGSSSSITTEDCPCFTVFLFFVGSSYVPQSVVLKARTQSLSLLRPGLAESDAMRSCSAQWEQELVG